MQPVPVTTNVVSSNPADDEVYSIQHYVTQLLVVGQWFSADTPSVSCSNKTDRHDISEILLRAALKHHDP